MGGLPAGRPGLVRTPDPAQEHPAARGQHRLAKANRAPPRFNPDRYRALVEEKFKRECPLAKATVGVVCWISQDGSLFGFGPLTRGVTVIRFAPDDGQRGLFDETTGSGVVAGCVRHV